VSIPIRFFSAPDDASAAEALDRDPESAAETTVRSRFLESSVLLEWETILTGRDPKGQAQTSRLVVADDRPRSSSKIFAASPELRAALAAADLERLSEVADQWVEQYGGRHGSFEAGEVSIARLRDAGTPSRPDGALGA
jgi:hypothetical protein